MQAEIRCSQHLISIIWLKTQMLFGWRPQHLSLQPKGADGSDETSCIRNYYNSLSRKYHRHVMFSSWEFHKWSFKSKVISWSTLFQLVTSKTWKATWSSICLNLGMIFMSNFQWSCKWKQHPWCAFLYLLECSTIQTNFEMRMLLGNYCWSKSFVQLQQLQFLSKILFTAVLAHDWK